MNMTKQEAKRPLIEQKFDSGAYKGAIGPDEVQIGHFLTGEDYSRLYRRDW